MYHPSTPEQFTDLVQEALYDVEDFIACLDDADPEEKWERYRPHALQVEAGLRQLKADLAAGAVDLPAAGDLPFYPDIECLGSDLPFRVMLEAINRVYREGLARH